MYNKYLTSFLTLIKQCSTFISLLVYQCIVYNVAKLLISRVFNRIKEKKIGLI